MKRPLLLLIMLLALGSIYAQDTNSETELKFTKQEIFNDYKIVYFVLDKPITEESYKDIYLDYKNDARIIEMYLESSTTCKAKLKLDVKPEEIQVYLKKHGYDFAFEIVIQNKQANTEIKKQNTSLTHFPKKIDTGNTKQDEKNFLEEFSKWRISYPQEWEQYQKGNTNKIK